MILYFCVFWNHVNGAPFINEVIPIPSQLGGITLVKFIREETVNTCPSTEYDDGDIQSVKSRAGDNDTRMLPPTTSVYIYTVKNYNPKQFNVPIHRSILLKPVQDLFSQIVAATKPTMIKYKSKWSLNDVILFRVGCEEAVNRGGVS